MSDKPYILQRPQPPVGIQPKKTIVRVESYLVFENPEELLNFIGALQGIHADMVGKQAVATLASLPKET